MPRDRDGRIIRSRPPMPAGEVRAKQLVIAPFGTDGNRTYSTLILGEDGCVYRYDPGCEGWIRWSMTIAGCRTEHKGKR